MLIQAEQVPEYLEETVEVGDLLLNVDISVVFVALVFLLGFHRFEVLLFNITEYFLDLVQIK